MFRVLLHFTVVFTPSIFSRCLTYVCVCGALYTRVFYGSVKIPNYSDISCVCFL